MPTLPAAIDSAQVWRPVETAPRDRDVLLWIPPSPLLADLIVGHMEVGRANPRDGRASHWLALPAPPMAEASSAILARITD